MEGFIAVVAAVLVVAYIAIAIFAIVQNDSVGQGIGTTLLFSAGGLVVIPVATFLASILCWGIFIAIAFAILGILGSIFG